MPDIILAVGHPRSCLFEDLYRMAAAFDRDTFVSRPVGDEHWFAIKRLLRRKPLSAIRKKTRQTCQGDHP